MSVRGKRIIITGAGSGIGAAAARMLAEAGAELGLVDLVEAETRALGRVLNAHAFQADVRDETAVETAVNAAVRALGGLDGLVNCAGTATVQTLENTSLTDWRRLVDTNMTGVFLTCRAAIPALRACGKGAIVNLASASGLTPSFAGAAYSASKAGVVMLSKALSRELAPTIRVNAVCPGAVRTPMFSQMTGEAIEAETAVGAGYALGRIASPEEIGTAIRFLIGDDSAFITGVALAVDGGRSFH
ncbi:MULTISPECIES: SDR family NAD(P)-dependent oxidoreductase [unclassified Brevundimonas]|uniref:SDR family NAD(P)-dependent oxidoreductase n=1 Tax=unclassified Brevundimonas TaxID=2622653 RepID=UPI0025C676F4|nr:MULTISPECIES: SDR family NAD(P)-dependent oxidoreductase [unclassified Brevundimonas]